MPMISKALIAASLKPIMLSLLSGGEAYGYEIIQRIGDLSDGKLQWTAGTLYPVLHRMEAEHLVEPVWRASESGPRRKYYRLTPRGRKALETEKRQWLDVHAVLLKLWGPEFSPAVSG
jgi:PadR family transcriptional regulator, regulatory protein PadR